MMHHKAPHRPWEPDDGARARSSRTSWIPEPETFWDSYATRTDALHENQQRVAADLTRPRSEADAAAGPRRATALHDLAGDEAGRGDDHARRQDA